MTGEQLAQLWHDEHCVNSRTTDTSAISSCWCCCMTCDPDWGGINPYFEIGSQEMRAEVSI
jgi:hypothetical protein